MIESTNSGGRDTSKYPKAEPDTALILKQTIGRRLTFFIKKICKTYKLTFNQFAKKVHMPGKILEYYQAGTIFPSTDLLVYVTWNFGLNIDWLYTGAGDWFIDDFVPDGKTPPPDHKQKIREQFRVLYGK